MLSQRRGDVPVFTRITMDSMNNPEQLREKRLQKTSRVGSKVRFKMRPNKGNVVTGFLNLVKRLFKNRTATKPSGPKVRYIVFQHTGNYRDYWVLKSTDYGETFTFSERFRKLTDAHAYIRASQVFKDNRGKND